MQIGSKNVPFCQPIRSNHDQSMATGTFTYNALRTKTLKERIKTQKNCKSFKLDKSNAVSIGTTVRYTRSFYMPSGLSLVRKVLW